MFDTSFAKRPRELQPGAAAVYLTQEMMKSRYAFSFYWKRGIELRHIENLKTPSGGLPKPIEPFNTESKEELPKRYRWILEFPYP